MLFSLKAKEKQSLHNTNSALSLEYFGFGPSNPVIIRSLDLHEMNAADVSCL